MGAVECFFCGHVVQKAFPLVTVGMLLDPDTLKPTGEFEGRTRWVCGSCAAGLRGPLNLLGETE